MNSPQEDKNEIEDSFLRMVEKIDMEGVHSAPLLSERRLKWRIILVVTTMIILVSLWGIGKIL